MWSESKNKASCVRGHLRSTNTRGTSASGVGPARPPPPRFQDTCCLHHLFGAHAHIPLLPLSLHAIFSPFSSNDLPATIDRSVGRATEPGREGGCAPDVARGRGHLVCLYGSIFCIAHRLDGCTPRFCGCNRIRSSETFFWKCQHIEQGLSWKKASV